MPAKRRAAAGPEDRIAPRSTLTYFLACSVCTAVLGCAGGRIACAQPDDTAALKQLLGRANGSVARLEPGRTYGVSEKLQLNTLCPRGVTIEGNGAVLQALPGFQHGVLLTATELLRDEPFAAAVKIRDLTVDGNGHVGRCVFGNWQNARVHELSVRGGTIYQVNAIWNDSMLTNIRVLGNAAQTNNGFDCNLQNSVIWNISVDMQGNLQESGLWLNGSQHATIVNAILTDGRTAFGLENCQDVNLIRLQARGRFSFRVVNILPAAPSQRIRLYDVQLAGTHVGNDPAAGIHFNATQGGLVARGRVATGGPGVMLSHGACDIDVLDVELPSPEVHPASDWKQAGRRAWSSKCRTDQYQSNRPPVVVAGPDRTAPVEQPVTLVAAVADERDSQDLVLRWSQLAGPAVVALEDASSARTRASFPQPGSYTLRITASDGQLESHDDLTIRVGN
jgi:hypothetical protein